MSFHKEPVSVKFCVLVVTLLAIIFLFFNIPQIEDVKAFLFFIILRIIFEHLEVVLPYGNGAITVSFAIDLAIIILFGPAAAAWANLSSLFTAKLFSNFKNIWYKGLYNMSQLALAAGITGYVYLLCGGTVGEIYLPKDVLPVALSSLVFYVINASFVVLVLSFGEKKSFWSVWVTNIRWASPNYLATAPLGVLIAATYLSLNIPGVILFTIPLIVARQTFNMYINMRDQYLSTIKALAKAIDAKDSYTLGHSERVAQYAVMIGREMRLPEDYIEKLEYLALLHDVGKISVPENILNKPSKLSDEEFRIVRNHAAVGAEIISNIQIIGKDANIIRHHHEWVNGRGYPDGLTEEEIPLGAKIVAVADAFDAMTSSRIYRKPLTIAEAVEELQRFAGIQFSKEVVTAFVKALRRRGDIQ